MIVNQTKKLQIINSDIAKFGTREERNTELAKNALRRPAKINESSLRQKIKLRNKVIIREKHGDKKRSKRAADDVVMISGRSCLSPSSNVARSLKM